MAQPLKLKVHDQNAGKYSQGGEREWSSEGNVGGCDPSLLLTRGMVQHCRMQLPNRATPPNLKRAHGQMFVGHVHTFKFSTHILQREV